MLGDRAEHVERREGGKLGAQTQSHFVLCDGHPNNLYIHSLSGYKKKLVGHMEPWNPGAAWNIGHHGLPISHR